MKVGDLVKWTLAWVVMRRDEALWDNVNYRNQVGILERECRLKRKRICRSKMW